MKENAEEGINQKACFINRKLDLWKEALKDVYFQILFSFPLRRTNHTGGARVSFVGHVCNYHG
jgi:hypothetical protein